MTSSSIADRYASALADLVTAPNSAVPPQDALAQLQEFSGLAQQSHELRTALESPAVSQSRKRAVIGRFVQVLGLAGIVRNFLFVLSDHRRLGSLREIVEAFDVQLDRRLGIVRADVSAAQELDQSELDAISARLAQVTGKQIRMRFAVDPSLIGGVVARVGSTVYDGSVRGRLDNLSKQLLVN